MLAIATKLVFSYNVSLPAGRKLDNRWLPITQATSTRMSLSASSFQI
jgi:hypothetical protein